MNSKRFELNLKMLGLFLQNSDQMSPLKENSSLRQYFKKKKKTKIKYVFVEHAIYSPSLANLHF